MGKKVTNPKLLKKGLTSQSMVSVFNSFADRLTAAHSRKIEKVGETKSRMMDAKKRNRVVKVSKRTTKFALIEDDLPMHGLTHRGKDIKDVQHFNDVNFDSDVEEDQFMKAHENLNFSGFDQQQKEQQSDRPKSKAEVYKEIMQKSKMHKHLRQQVYEQNFQKAVQLDEQFPQLLGKLKFRTRNSNVKDQIMHGDHQFQKLANQLKEDQRVVSNKVIEKNQKSTDRIQKKKNQQLNKLMKDNSDSEDIRDWAKGARSEGEEDEEDQDQIDDVQLSSGEESDGEQEDGEQVEEEEEEEEDDYEEQQADEQHQSEGEEQNQESQQEEIVPKKVVKVDPAHRSLGQNKRRKL